MVLILLLQGTFAQRAFAIYQQTSSANSSVQNISNVQPVFSQKHKNKERKAFKTKINKALIVNLLFILLGIALSILSILTFSLGNFSGLLGTLGLIIGIILIVGNTIDIVLFYKNE
jgi:hypothetical protein